MKEMTRRQALLSIATIAAGTVLTSRSAFSAAPAKTKIRFPIVGDVGTGNHDQIGIAKTMFQSHQRAPFVLQLRPATTSIPTAAVATSGSILSSHSRIC